MLSFISANNMQPSVGEEIRWWDKLIEYKTLSRGIIR